MKKFALSFFAFALFLNTNTASAGMRPLTEWNGGTPSSFAGTPSAPREMTIPDSGASAPSAGLPMTAEEYCPKACPGFAPDIQECDEGLEPKACTDYDCSNYYKCVPVICQDGYDSSFKDCPISVQDNNFRCTRCI